jgi:hypothetical protein
MSKPKSVGGGGHSQHVRPPVRAGSPQTRKVTADGASSVGRIIGTHTTDHGETQRPNRPLYEPTKAAVRMGNDVALNVGRGGPGTGRTVHPCGSQGQHGAAPAGYSSPQPRDILSDFGPERGGGRR